MGKKQVLDSQGLTHDERLPMVVALTTLGITNAWTAEHLGVNELTVANDLRRGGKPKGGDKKKLDKKTVFATVFRQYAGLAAAKKTTALSRDDTWLLEALAKWLRAGEIAAFVRGQAWHQSHLSSSHYPQAEEGIYRLAQSILCVEDTSRDSLIRAAEKNWDDYLTRVADSAHETPDSRESIFDRLTECFAEEHSHEIRPPWPRDARERMDYVLNTLEKDRAELLRTLYGIDRQRRTLAAAASELGEKTFTVRMRENAALIKLRQRTLQQVIWPLLFFADPLSIEASLERPKPTRDAYFKRVDELELSVRTANWLELHIKVVFIGELVQKTETWLLKEGFGGRKSIKEIRELLEETGLSLGMELDPELVREIDEAAARVRQEMSVKPSV